MTPALLARRCIVASEPIPRDHPVIEEAEAAVEELVHDMRAEMRDAQVEAREASIVQTRREILEEQRMRALPLRRLADIPRVDPEDPELDELSDEWQRLSRFAALVSPPEDRTGILDSGAAHTELPPTRDILDALWDRGVVADPQRIPRSIGLDFGIERHDDRCVELRKLVAQAPALAALFRSAQNLPTPKGRTTRALVLEDHDLLVTRWTPSHEGGARLIAKRFDDSLRAEREGRHLMDEVRAESAQLFPWTLELDELRRQLSRWNQLPPEAKTTLGEHAVAFLRRVAEDLGSPRRQLLAKHKATLAKVRLQLAKNPGALLASTVGLSELFEDLGRIGESRATTVTADTDAIHRLNWRTAEQQATALSTTKRIQNEVDLSTASNANLAEIFTSITRALEPRDDVELQPAADLRADVSALVDSGTSLLETPPSPERTRHLQQIIIGIVSILKHGSFHGLVERLRGAYTLGRSRDERRIRHWVETVNLGIGEALENEHAARAQKRVGVPRNPKNPLLPETYHRDRQFRRKLELVRAFAQEQLSEQSVEPAEAAKLASHLDAIDARAALRDVSVAVRADVALGDTHRS